LTPVVKGAEPRQKLYLRSSSKKKFGLKIFFPVLENPNDRPGTPYKKGRLSTVDLLVNLGSFVRNKIFFPILVNPNGRPGNPCKRRLIKLDSFVRNKNSFTLFRKSHCHCREPLLKGKAQYS
jgi:hypothetical protein